MHLITRNVNTAFHELVSLFNNDDYAVNGENPVGVIKRPSRNGPVLMIDEPVMVTYTHPKERVLFNQARDANPFLHLYESLWMLAGRNDVAPLAYYAKQFEQYSDDGKTLNGAYGYRWRNKEVFDPSVDIYAAENREESAWVKHDQLDILVEHLKANPTSRRAVLQMWNIEDDLLKIGGNVCGWCEDGGQDNCLNCGQTGIPKGSKDVCCNTAVYFSIREEIDMVDSGGFTPDMRPIDIPVKTKFLDITVTNRSNDMIWGMLGANVVHFSFLQEYMAAQIGVEVGRYTQMTNNLHCYENNFDPKKWLSYYESESLMYPISSQQLISCPTQFDKELPEFVELNKSSHIQDREIWKEPYLRETAQPLLNIFHARKLGISYQHHIDQVSSKDWKLAASNWVYKRDNHAKDR